MEWFAQLPEFAKDPTFQGTVIVGALSVVFGFLRSFLERKGKLGWGVSHGHTYVMPNRSSESEDNPDVSDDGEESKEVGTQRTVVRTVEIWVQNIGGATVNNTEIILNFRPQHFDIWPPLQYEETTNPDGRFVVIVKKLHRRQHFTLSMLVVNGENPNVVGVSWEGGLGREVPMGPQQIFNRWVIQGLRVLLMIGAASVVYFSASLML